MLRAWTGARVAALLGGAAVLFLAGAAAWVSFRHRLESTVRSRIERAAAEQGATVRVDAVHVGLDPFLSLRGLHIEKAGRYSLDAPTIDLALRPWGNLAGGSVRVALGPAHAAADPGITLDMPETVWDVRHGGNGRVKAALRAPGESLSLEWAPRKEGGGDLTASAERLVLEHVCRVAWRGSPLTSGGLLGGTARIGAGKNADTFDIDEALQGVSVEAFLNEGNGEGPALFGEPTDLRVTIAGSWYGEQGSLRVERYGLASPEATVFGSLLVENAPSDPSIDLSLEVQRLDFGRVLMASGLGASEAAPLKASGGDLGSGSLSARVRGRLADPRSIEVTQKLDFKPPARMPDAIGRLRGDFVHEAVLPNGARTPIQISQGAQSFISLSDVPPLFLRTLLIAEDAAFFSHHGIDLSEVTAAILENRERGRARGASTISQQLAKNLFLSREKRLGRKLQELCLSLLLESALGKQRILEIYLNVIEWGPGLYGLRPASEHYFHKEPGDLSPKQMAFLVALIPGPVKYQSTFADGTPSAGFMPLVNDLLVKLRSVDALSEEEYEQALAEDLVVGVGADAGRAEGDSSLPRP
jgi:hypothetical protein